MYLFEIIPVYFCLQVQLCFVESKFLHIIKKVSALNDILINHTITVK